MKVQIVSEAGYEPAILGLSLSYGQTDWTRMQAVADRLASKDGGENKYLRFVQVYLDITAPRYWWQEFDTYKVGTCAQSASTIHSIVVRPLTPNDFEDRCCYDPEIDNLNYFIEEYKKTDCPVNRQKFFMQIKIRLPEGFLQRRIVCLNYATLRNIFKQRKGHRLPQWETFIDAVFSQCQHPAWLEDCM